MPFPSLAETFSLENILYQSVRKDRASREAATGPDASGFSFERSVLNTSARAPRSGLRAVACACAWEGGGCPHPALSRRRPGVSGAVRSAEGYDCKRLSRSSARKAQLRTQGGGDSKGNFQPNKLLRRAAICLLLLVPLLPLGCFRAPSLSSVACVCHSLALGQRQRPRTEPALPCVLQWEASVSTREISGPDAPARAGLCVPRTVGASGRGRGVLQRFLIILHEVDGELCAPKGLVRGICLLER